MKTHYNPSHTDLADVEVSACGVFLGESSDLTGEWDRVTCLRCLSGRGRMETAIKRIEINHRGS